MPYETGQSTTGEILQLVVHDIGEIIQAEMRLARAELRESAQKAGKAGGLLGGAAIAGLLAAGCLVTAAIAALALVMPVWLAAAVVAVVLGIAGAVLYAGGKTKLKEVQPVPERTVATLKEDWEWAKHRTS